MAKRILVNEGDKIKTISNVTKLVTRLQNGNMCTWVPEDELLLATKTIVKDGTYKAASEAGSPYGYSQVTVNGVGTEIMGELSEKSITKNGTYRASEDKDGPFYGYSKVYVGVSGGGSGGESQEPIGGTDDDGDPAIAEVDDDGTIVFSKAPTFIRVTKNPTVTEYNVGQTINYSGIEVTAYVRADEIWTNPRYPDGKIPFEELIFPITVARRSSIDFSIENAGISNSADTYLGTIGSRAFYKKYNGEAITLFRNSYGDYKRTRFVGPLLISTSIENVTYYYGPTICTYTRSFTYKDSILYYNLEHHLVNPEPLDTGGWGSIILPQDDRDQQEIVMTEYLDEHNMQVTDTTLYPVEWKRLGDRKVLRTSVRIYATDDSGGGQDPEPAPTPSPD